MLVFKEKSPVIAML